MSSEELLTKENENSDVEKPNFITSFQFAALTKHFEDVLENIKQEERLERFRSEFARLLDTFKSCYAESDRKTRKIRELLAEVALEHQKVISRTSQQEESVKDLRETIRILQRDLDVAKEQRRELLEDIADLGKNIEKEDKSTQVRGEFLEIPSNKDKNAFTSGDSKLDDGLEMKFEFLDKQRVSKKSEGKGKNETTDVKALKNDLDILVADLKLTRKNVADLKRELQGRDVVIKEYSKDLSDSELMLTETQRKISEIRNPLEKSLKRCKVELENERKKLRDVSKNLQEALMLNTKLSKDIETKGSIIDDLKTKIGDLCLEKDSAAKKADTFEEHLAQSQVNIQALEKEIQTLKEEAKKLEKEIPVGAAIYDIPEKDQMEINVQERLVENLKTQISIRDRRTHQVIEELRETVGVLQSLKKDFAAMNKEKVTLESELQEAKKNLKEKSGEVKQLKERSIEDKKEMEETKKNLYTWIKKYQQIVEKKNKFHNLYNLVKIKSGQQENENAHLGKRQQYLVKILKDKDKEIERLVSWKRYVV